MGAQWKHAGQQANANKKGQIIGKLVKEIAVAAKMGDPAPEHNPRLRVAIESAKKHSVTRDTIERAIKKGAGIGDDAATYETITWEGFAPHKIPVIIESLTDNKNRTSADMRVLFRKGQLGNAGAVGWMFDRLGVVEATFKEPNQDIETVAIEAGAQNFEPLDATEIVLGQSGGRFFTDPTDLAVVTKYLNDQGWTVTVSELSYVAKNAVELDDEAKKDVVDFLGSIDDHDDTHRIYTALK